MLEINPYKGKNEEISDFIHLIAAAKGIGNDISYSLRPDPFWISRNISLWQRKPVQWKMKRLFDLALSIIGSILISPILFIIAIAIKLDSKGPIFFKQKRIGLYGKEFFMYKFRSMKINAEDQFDQIKHFNETNYIMFKMKEDPRITRVGKIIRKYSLDELPQLINVIKGEMSLVGPRPPIKKEVEKYEKWHFLRFSTLPGLTGIWQVSGRAKITDFNTVVKLDYQYIHDWDIKLDLLLLFKTIPVVISAKGAS
jgi:lipopolysaccharide/colanic/teichoic acid biosynthesis glycosyltransferase